MIKKMERAESCRVE
jgi:hypothetical protein